MRCGISDTHLGDPDLHRLITTPNGQKEQGFSLLENYAVWALDNHVATTGLGDIFDWSGSLAQDLVTYDDLLRDIGFCRGGRSRFLAGNHDRLLRGALSIGCLPADHLVEVSPDGESRYLMRHGYVYDDFPWEEKPMLRERILKAGRRIDLGAPRLDEAVRRGFRRLSDRFMPRGIRYGMDFWVDAAIKEAKAVKADIVLIGHNHLLFSVIKYGIQVVSLGAWTPKPVKGGERIDAGVWDFQNRQLYRINAYGMTPVMCE